MRLPVRHRSSELASALSTPASTNPKSIRPSQVHSQDQRRRPRAIEIDARTAHNTATTRCATRSPMPSTGPLVDCTAGASGGMA